MVWCEQPPEHPQKSTNTRSPNHLQRYVEQQRELNPLYDNG
jgi:hypothetical protein